MLVIVPDGGNSKRMRILYSTIQWQLRNNM